MKIFLLFVLMAIFAVSETYGHGSHPHTHIDDGQVHIIDADNPFHGAFSIDLYNTTETGTHIKVVDGGVAEGIPEHTTSFAFYNNSRFTMTGGTVTKRVSTLDNVQVSISGGNLEALLIQQNSTATVSGGTINGLLSSLGESITFTGGTVIQGARSAGNANFTMTGGHINGYFHGSSPNTFIKGGVIQDYIESKDGGHITISGGILGGGLQLSMDSMMTLVGSNFMIDGNPIDFGQYDKTFFGVNQYHQITGILANGDLLSTSVNFIDWSSGPNYSTLELVAVPEPGTVVLLGLGAVVLRRRRR